MMELAQNQKFWIRGDKDNPLGVIQTLCDQGVTAEVPRWDYRNPHFIFYLDVVKPYGSSEERIEIQILSEDREDAEWLKAEWLKAAWPEIKPRHVESREVGGFTIRPRGENSGRCKSCQFDGLCIGGCIENKKIERLIFSLFGTLAPCWEEIIPTNMI